MADSSDPRGPLGRRDALGRHDPHGRRDWPGRRHWLGGLGVVLATVALGVGAGLPGAVAGLGAVLAWYLLAPTYAFAVGQLLAVAATGLDASAMAGGGVAVTAGDGVPLVAVAAVEVGLLALLVGPLLGTGTPGRAVGAFVATGVAALAVAWALLGAGQPLALAALAVALLVATAAYGVHRYERVAFGLVRVDAEDGRDSSTGGRASSTEGGVGPTDGPEGAT